MYRFCLGILVAGFLCLTCVANEQLDSKAVRDAAEIYQKALQEVIKEAEPSIACVLVSRSDAYKKIFHDEAPAPTRLPGGKAVEVVEANKTHRLVPVTPGLFDDAQGLVQVAGGGLAVGQRVVVPAS